MHKTPISPDESKTILADYAAGVTVTQLGKKYDRQNCTIVRFLRKAGVFVKKENWDKSSAKLTPETVAEIGKEYQKGATQDALAARYGISQTLVRNALEKAGVQSRSRGKQTNFSRVQNDTAYCSSCDTRKPISEFHMNLATGLPMYQCKECSRWGKRAKAYGISREEYKKLFEAQGGRCKCCGKAYQGTESHPDLVVDHDHATGAVRGLLCPDCNKGLGSFKDSKEALLGALAYLGESAS